MTREAAARSMCHQAGALQCALDAERWASSLLGRLWERREILTPADAADHAFALGKPIVEDFALVNTRGAAIALQAIQKVADGGLGPHAGELALKLSHPARPIPDWVAEIGTAKVARAAIAGVPDEGDMVFLEARSPTHIPHTVVVYLDHTLGGFAKHLGLIQPIESFEHGLGDDPLPCGVPIRPLEPALAARRIRAAIALTDGCPDAPVGETFADLRALTLLRARSVLV
jgi:hypothetical protein